MGLAPGQPEYRILIVEDQRENQLLLTQLMEKVGFLVKIAENGALGVQLFQSWRSHFIWMDRRMPVMDGMEATRRIRQLPDGKAVKIIAVTASVLAEQHNEMLNAGMDSYVRKPYRADEVYQVMSEQLGVKYLYEEAAKAPEKAATFLTPEMFETLPESLRSDLIQGLELLDNERIDTIIQQVANYDWALHKTLSQLAAN